MDTMLQAEGMTAHLNCLAAGEPSPNEIFIGFQNEWMEPALCKMQRGAQSGNATTDDNNFRIIHFSPFYHN
jgi:hypothetical protein